MNDAPPNLQDQDESVRIGIKALGDIGTMPRELIFDRYRRPSTSEPSNVTLPSTSESPQSSQPTPGSLNQSEFIPIESKDPGLPKVKLKSGFPEISAIDEHPSSRIANDSDESRFAKGKARSWLHASSPFVGPAPTPPDLTSSSSSSQSPTDLKSPSVVGGKQSYLKPVVSVPL
ncbi:hypothetical protein C0995_007039 [Termitomyces sp. Mi166|nr:hypothetical protein C0995_007039 [Termitomyces sp. Mi166\